MPSHHIKALVASIAITFGLAGMGIVVIKFLRVRKSYTSKTMKETKEAYSEEHIVAPYSTDQSWRHWLSPKQHSLPKIPALAAIIEAGDGHTYSSSLFERIPLNYVGPAAGSSWEPLYESFANELASKPLSERALYPSQIYKFMNDRRKRIKRTMSARALKSSRSSSSVSRRNTLDLSEKGMNSVRQWKSLAELISCFNPMPSSQSPRNQDFRHHASWMDSLKHMELHGGKNTIPVTSEELISLALVLGMHVEHSSPPTEEKSNITKSSLEGTGAFGISLSREPTADGKYLLRLHYSKPFLPQLPSRGSGYSTLFAKHLAFGSLPISENDQGTQSIIINHKTFKAIKAGTHLILNHLEKSTPESTYLDRLPSSKPISYYTLVTHASSSNTSPQSTPYPPTPLIAAIAALPFTGGLTPLASTSLLYTVRFVASGGANPGRLLQRLEDLIHKVHRYSPHLQLFGPLLEDANLKWWLRERQNLGDPEALNSDPEASVPRVGRYITLLERLMALVPDMSRGEILDAVREGARAEVEAAYQSALGRAPRDESQISPRAYGSTLPAASAVEANGTLPLYNTQAPQSQVPIQAPRRAHTRTRSWSLSRRDSVLTSQRNSTSEKRSSRKWSISDKRISLNFNDGNRASIAEERSSTSTGSSTPSSLSVTADLDLGRQLELILKRSLPFDVQTVARVARLVLVAWTFSAGAVGWDEEDERGRRLVDLDELPAKMYLC